MKTKEMYAEALTRAENCRSSINIAMVMMYFSEKGIPENDIRPGENVLTFNAWKAKGRSVKKGEHGCKITTYITKKKDKKGEEEYTFPKTVAVFHRSQTVEIFDKKILRSVMQ